MSILDRDVARFSPLQLATQLCFQGGYVPSLGWTRFRQLLLGGTAQQPSSVRLLAGRAEISRANTLGLLKRTPAAHVIVWLLSCLRTSSWLQTRRQHPGSVERRHLVRDLQRTRSLRSSKQVSGMLRSSIDSSSSIQRYQVLVSAQSGMQGTCGHSVFKHLKRTRFLQLNNRLLQSQLD